MQPLSRRGLIQSAGIAAAPILTEFALAQRAAVPGAIPKDTVWLNANENPDGPPKPSIEAMIKVLPEAGRYHYQEYQDFYARVARSEGLRPEQILIGSGSSEVLQAAVHAFTSASRPLICPSPTYEAPLAVTEALGRKVIRVPLRPDLTSDVRALAEAADRAGGGLIYLCNPNNPTSTITKKDEIAWLVSNLPQNTIALIDEAYIHFSESPEIESAFRYIDEGKDVIVTRSYSKIYGMAGLRAGFVAGRPELVRKMEPFRNNVISIVTVRALLAAVDHAATVIPERRKRYNGLRADVCQWLRSKGIGYVDPHANFLMIHLNRDARDMQMAMVAKGVAPGRPFPPLDRMLRVSIGTQADMEKFKKVFWEVYSA